MNRLSIVLCVVSCLLALAIPLSADEGPEMTRAGVWYRSSAQTEPVNAGEGYFCLRLVQAQVVTSRPGWFTSLLTGSQGVKQIFASMQFAYGPTSLQSPLAWGEVRPEKPRLPQSRLQITPWLPVVTRSGAPVQPTLAVMLRTLPVSGGGILGALHVLAERAASAGALTGIAQATDVIFTYQDVFEQVFSAFTPRQTTPTSVTFHLATGDQTQQVRFSKYLLVTDAGAKLQRTRQGKVETFRWDEWEKHLTVPGDNSTSPYVVWSDTGEPLQEVSFLLFEIATLPRFFRDFESVHAAPELYKTIYKLVVMPLTSALEGKREPQEIAATLRVHLDQLREWLWNEQPGISMKDIETICKVVGAKAMADAGVGPEVTVKIANLGLESLLPPPAGFDPAKRPALHRAERWVVRED